MLAKAASKILLTPRLPLPVALLEVETGGFDATAEGTPTGLRTPPLPDEEISPGGLAGFAGTLGTVDV